jgi:hypothetical protein
MGLKSKIICFFAIIFWFLTPIPHYFEVGSLSTGLFSFVLIIILMYTIRQKSIITKGFLLKTFGAFFLILLHSIFCLFQNEINFQRWFGSLLLLILLIYGAVIISTIASNFKSEVVHIMAKNIFVWLIFLFILSSIPFVKTSWPFNLNNKSIFPFKEPSHYTLFFSPIIYYFISVSKGVTRYFYVALTIFMGLYVQNLTMLLSLLLILIVVYHRKLLFIGVICTLFYFTLLENEYFANRLNFSDENNNLSVLVYLQGWEFANNHFANTSGVGIGFQQLGFVKIYTVMGDKLESILKIPLNEKDGGFTAAKVVAEFGVLGLFFLLSYVYFFIKTCKKLINLIEQSQHNNILILSCCLVISSFIEIFFRGVGYFSPTLFLSYTGALILINSKLKNNDRISVIV